MQIDVRGGPRRSRGVPGGRLRPKFQGKRPDVARCGWNRAPRAFAVLDSTLHKPYAVAPQMTRKSTTKKCAGTTVRRSTYQRVTCERWPANSTRRANLKACVRQPSLRVRLSSHERGGGRPLWGRGGLAHSPKAGHHGGRSVGLEIGFYSGPCWRFPKLSR